MRVSRKRKPICGEFKVKMENGILDIPNIHTILRNGC
jgi:hypothetical protein